MSVQGRPEDYAKAIYDLAFENWVLQLEGIQKAVAADRALQAALEDPADSIQKKLQLLEGALSGELDPQIRKFLGTLLEAGQLGDLSAILIEFERLVYRRAERRLARVVSAVSLTEEEESDMRTRLVKRFGPDLEFQFEVDPSLLGGVYLRVGDQVIDGSVAGKLASLRDRLAS